MPIDLAPLVPYDLPFESMVFLASLTGKLTVALEDAAMYPYATIKVRQLPPAPYPPRVYPGMRAPRGRSAEVVVDIAPERDRPTYYGDPIDVVSLRITDLVEAVRRYPKTVAPWKKALVRTLARTLGFKLTDYVGSTYEQLMALEEWVDNAAGHPAELFNLMRLLLNAESTAEPEDAR